MGAFERQIDVAVSEELLDTVVRFVGLDVRPVGHVELLVYGEAPLFVSESDSAVIALGTQVFSVKSVAV